MAKALYHPDGRRLVFRIENDYGEGPYCAEVESEQQSKILARLLLKEPLNSTQHPTPRNDSGLCNFWEHNKDIRYEYLFGFRDMDQLTNWFMWPRRMWHMREHASIAVYAVDVADDLYNVVYGQFQTIFFKPAAERVAVLPLYATEFDVTTLA